MMFRNPPKKAYTTPRDIDVKCGRGKGCFEHMGNEILRARVALTLEEYSSCWKKEDKTDIINRIVGSLYADGCRFLKYDPDVDMWYDGGIKLAKTRVGIAFRDAMQPNKVKCMDAMKEIIESTKLSSMSTAMAPLADLQKLATTNSRSTILPLHSESKHDVPESSTIHLHSLHVGSQCSTGERAREGQGEDDVLEKPATQFYFEWSDDSIDLVEAGYLVQALDSGDETYCTKLLEDIDDLTDGCL
jgi:hypothetical protein